MVSLFCYSILPQVIASNQAVFAKYIPAIRSMPMRCRQISLQSSYSFAE